MLGGAGGLALAGSADEVDLIELWRKLWRRKWLVVASTMVLSLIAGLVIMSLTPRYTAQATVVVETRKAKVVDVEAVLSGLSPDDQALSTEILIIRSVDLVKRVIEALRLDRDPEFNSTLRPPSLLGRLPDPRRLLPAAWRSGRSDAAGGTRPDAAEQAELQTTKAVLQALHVARVGHSRVIKIGFTSENPRTAASVVNLLADLYIRSQLEVKFKATEDASQWLRERLTGLRRQVEASDNAVEVFRNESGLFRIGDATLVGQELNEAVQQIEVERAKISEGDARLRQMAEQLTTPAGIETVAEVLHSPLIQRLREQEAVLERKVAELLTTYGERHPKLINAKAEVRDIRDKIGLEATKILQGLRNEVAVARVREADLETRVDALKDDMARLNRAQVQLRALEREAAANRVLFETFLARFKETSAQENFQQPDARILSLAGLPARPSYPKRAILLLTSVVGALFLSILLGFVIEALDHSFRSAEQVEQIGTSLLGLVPELKELGRTGHGRDAYILEKPASPFAEAIRSLHTSLLLANTDKPPKVILIASSVVNEGKTTLALSLARLQASVGRSVAIVDCDLRRPAVHKALGCQAWPGLVEVLGGEATLDDAMQLDPVSGAHLLVAGAPAADPAALLGSEQMKRLLRTLAQSHDLVVVDSAPVLAVSDTQILSRLVDKTVFVVRWAATPREVAAAGLRRVVDAGADVLGVLLNNVDTSKFSRRSYGYVRDYGSRIGEVAVDRH